MMPNKTAPTALIAEDEPLLAAALRKQLAELWPELVVLATVGDGIEAAAQALTLQPDVLFFDISMPGMNGIDAAGEIAEDWPAGTQPFPLLVFVTAFDDYACRAFDAQAVDYLLKPLQSARLTKTIAKLKSMLTQRAAAPAADFDATLERLRHLIDAQSDAVPPQPLQFIQVGVANAQGTQIRMVPVEQVLYFEAADKYVRVVTAEREYLIRTALKELLPQLPPTLFWRIHRGTVVRVAAIESAHRNESGRYHVSVAGRPEKLAVGRLYTHLFRPM